MRAVVWLQRIRNPVPGKLRAKTGRKMRNVSHFPLITSREGLHSREVALGKSGRLRIAGKKKFVGAIDIFDPRPQIVSLPKPQRRLQQISVADVAVIQTPVSSPQY